MRTDKLYMPKNRNSNIRHNPTTGLWDYDVRIARPDGTRFRRANSCKSEADARRGRDASYAEYNRDQGLGREDVKRRRAEHTDTVRSWSDRAMSELREEMAPTTHDAYRMALANHVHPTLGDTPLDELRRGTILRLLKGIPSVHVRCQARNALVRVLRYAVDAEVLTENPMSELRLGVTKPKSKGSRFLTKREATAIMSAAVGTEAYMPCLLGLRFGTRIAEALALLWEDVDLDKRIVAIREQFVCVKGAGRLRMPLKHDANARFIPIDDDVLAILRVAKPRARAAGHPYVCCYPDGSPLSVKHVGQRQIKGVVLTAGLDGKDGKPVPTAHDFRRSWITWMAQASPPTPLTTLARLAGHRDVSTTAQFYVGVETDETREAVKKAAFALPEPSKLDEVLGDEAA